MSLYTKTLVSSQWEGTSPASSFSGKQKKTADFRIEDVIQYKVKICKEAKAKAELPTFLVTNILIVVSYFSIPLFDELIYLTLTITYCWILNLLLEK